MCIYVYTRMYIYIYYTHDSSKHGLLPLQELLQVAQICEGSAGSVTFRMLSGHIQDMNNSNTQIMGRSDTSIGYLAKPTGTSGSSKVDFTEGTTISTQNHTSQNSKIQTSFQRIVPFISYMNFPFCPINTPLISYSQPMNILFISDYYPYETVFLGYFPDGNLRLQQLAQLGRLCPTRRLRACGGAGDGQGLGWIFLATKMQLGFMSRKRSKYTEIICCPAGDFSISSQFSCRDFHIPRRYPYMKTCKYFPYPFMNIPQNAGVNQRIFSDIF